jgi:hypothetical protein
VFGPARRCAVVERFAKGGICACIEHGFDHLNVAVLSGDVQSGDVVAVARTSKGRAAVGVGAEFEQARDGARATASIDYPDVTARR